MRNDLQFDSADAACAAWHYPGQNNDFDGPSGRPCVVIAPGLAATRDSGFEPFADRLSQAGVDVLLFDYRGFGASGGSPRHVVNVRQQRQDYHDVIACARRLPSVDPEKIVLMGISLSGGHVIYVGADDQRVAAVISVTPAADCLANMRMVLKSNGLLTTAQVMAKTVGDRIAALRGHEPVTVPVVGPPRSGALFTNGHAVAGYTASAGATWRNEIAARISLSIWRYRPVIRAGELRCPTLIQVADQDTMASARATIRAAWRARADVRHYPCDHFDVHLGHDWFEPAVEHQIHFCVSTSRNRAVSPIASGSL